MGSEYQHDTANMATKFGDSTNRPYNMVVHYALCNQCAVCKEPRIWLSYLVIENEKKQTFAGFCHSYHIQKAVLKVCHSLACSCNTMCFIY